MSTGELKEPGSVEQRLKSGTGSLQTQVTPPGPPKPPTNKATGEGDESKNIYKQLLTPLEDFLRLYPEACKMDGSLKHPRHHLVVGCLESIKRVLERRLKIEALEQGLQDVPDPVGQSEELAEWILARGPKAKPDDPFVSEHAPPPNQDEILEALQHTLLGDKLPRGLFPVLPDDLYKEAAAEFGFVKPEELAEEGDMDDSEKDT